MELVKQKYSLHVMCDHDEKHELYVPLALQGDETIEKAIEMFKYAILVAQSKMMEHHGRKCISSKRIDGIPSQEEIERDKEVGEILAAIGSRA